MTEGAVDSQHVDQDAVAPGSAAPAAGIPEAVTPEAGNSETANTGAERLVDGYDVALFDLDGVVYLGNEAVPGAAEGIGELRETDVAVGFVTNNAARSPHDVARHLRELGVPASGSDVITSAQAAARVLADRLEPEALVLVVGSPALGREVAKVGLTPCRAGDCPGTPAAVVQGYYPKLVWSELNEAAFAIADGALWVATNTDSTRPTERGIAPGAGALVQAIQLAVDAEPVVAGKPDRPLMEESLRRTGARHAIFVGDRIDTDIEGAINVGIDSLFVFTGAHGKADLVKATHRPTHLGWSLRALLEPARQVTEDSSGPGSESGNAVRCGEATASVRDGRVQVEGGNTVESQLDGLRAVLHLVGSDSDLDTTSALAALDLIP